jgi:hypothetical protein
MSHLGQSRRFGDVCDMSALPPTTAVMMQCRERQKGANNGRERVQQWMHQKAGYWITSSARASLAAAPAIAVENRCSEEVGSSAPKRI